MKNYVDVSDLEDKIKEQSNKIKELEEELNDMKTQMMIGFTSTRGNIGGYDE